MGRIWVLLMITIATSSLFIHGIEMIGPFSPIHLLSLWVLLGVPFAVRHARRGRVDAHRRAMVGLFVGALVIAGALTLLPGRVMHEVLFGA